MFSLKERNKRLEVEKVELRDHRSNKMDEMGMNLQKLSEENESNIRIIKDLRQKVYSKEIENHQIKDEKSTLERSNQLLKEELDLFKVQFNRKLGKSSVEINIYEESVKKLELEVTRVNSKFDETYLELTELKKKYAEQLKQVIY